MHLNFDWSRWSQQRTLSRRLRSALYGAAMSDVSVHAPGAFFGNQTELPQCSVHCVGRTPRPTPPKTRGRIVESSVLLGPCDDVVHTRGDRRWRGPRGREGVGSQSTLAAAREPNVPAVRRSSPHRSVIKHVRTGARPEDVFAEFSSTQDFTP